MTKTGEPMAPLSFRGFWLHTVWNQPPGGDSVCQVAFPRLPGEATTPMLEYKPEKFPQSLVQGPKMAVNLGPPFRDYWNIDSDLVLPLAIDTYKRRHETKWAEQDPEVSLQEQRVSKGGTCSQEGSSGCGGWQQSCIPNRGHTPGAKSLGDCAQHSRTHPHPLSPDTT